MVEIVDQNKMLMANECLGGVVNSFESIDFVFREQ